MRGVTQRVEGWPRGECVRASYASLFEMPIDEVPRFDPEAQAMAGYKSQLQMERDWLETLGLDLRVIQAGPEGATLVGGAPAPAGVFRWRLPESVLQEAPPVHHLISGVSPRNFGHRCVGFGGRVVWDPHPSRGGLVSVYSLGFIVPRSQ